MTTNYDPIAAVKTASVANLHRSLHLDGTDRRPRRQGGGRHSLRRRLLQPIRQRGAGKVTAVDFSERMIELARAQEAEHRLGIDYIIGDAKELTLGAEYDLAVAAYLLNYARDRDELGALLHVSGSSTKRMIGGKRESVVVISGDICENC